jgi:hypothetical protein
MVFVQYAKHKLTANGHNIRRHAETHGTRVVTWEWLRAGQNLPNAVYVYHGLNHISP